MGRGRAKAKQTKVARELKYRSVDTDFTTLQRELHGGSAGEGRREVAPVEEPDPYEGLADKYAIDDDDEDDRYRRLG